jgi:Tfp pilus assembly protein PilN
MTTPPPLNLNLATRPLRNRRLFKTAVWALAGLMTVCAGLSAWVVLKYGGQARGFKAAGAEARRLQDEALREKRRLDADIKRAEDQSRLKVGLVNAVILKKSFRWTALFAELEKALPGPSFITALTPAFTADGSVALHLRVTSRSLDDLSSFITALTAGGFKDIKVGGEQRSEDGRLIAEIDLRYERAL